jgi:uncharacterized Zn finger protein (UPF0148 family)
MTTEQICPSCSTPYADHPGLVTCCAELRKAKRDLAAARAETDAAKKEAAELIAIVSDCWDQWKIEIEADGEQWDSDGAMSTLEEIADYLCKRGLLAKHPTRPVYRWAEKANKP